MRDKFPEKDQRRDGRTVAAASSGFVRPLGAPVREAITTHRFVAHFTASLFGPSAGGFPIDLNHRFALPIHGQ